VSDDRDGGGLLGALLVVLLVVGAASGTAGATSSTRHRTALAAADVPAVRSARCGQAFVRSIVTQESNGNYRARSAAGALGKYQIMPGNIPAWSREILGHPVSVQQFLDSPTIQDKVAVGKLDRYCAAYGPAGAAAVWYSGDPGRRNDCSPVSNGPPVCEYVRSVLARI
jgi:Transglycosylase SLT domain